jgi:hypothetical protein
MTNKVLTDEDIIIPGEEKQEAPKTSKRGRKPKKTATVEEVKTETTEASAEEVKTEPVKEETSENVSTETPAVAVTEEKSKDVEKVEEKVEEPSALSGERTTSIEDLTLEKDETVEQKIIKIYNELDDIDLPELQDEITKLKEGLQQLETRLAVVRAQKEALAEEEYDKDNVSPLVEGVRKEEPLVYETVPNNNLLSWIFLGVIGVSLIALIILLSIVIMK